MDNEPDKGDDSDSFDGQRMEIEQLRGANRQLVDENLRLVSFVLRAEDRGWITRHERDVLLDLRDDPATLLPLTGGASMNDELTAARMTYEFTLLIEGADLITDPALDALFAAGCFDATFGTRGGTQYAEFGREAESFVVALTTAIAAVEVAVPGARVFAWSRTLMI